MQMISPKSSPSNGDIQLINHIIGITVANSDIFTIFVENNTIISI